MKLLLLAFAAPIAAYAIAALVSRIRERRAAEIARRRAMHPSTRNVTKRTVHIAPESWDMWAELDTLEGAS